MSERTVLEGIKRTFSVAERGIVYGEIEDPYLRITLRAGELVRLTAQMDKTFNRVLASKGIKFVEAFGQGDDSGLNLDFIVEKIIEADGMGGAIRVLSGTILGIDENYGLNGDKEQVVTDLEIVRDRLRRRYRALKS